MRRRPIIAIVLVFAVSASWRGSYLAFDGFQSGILMPAPAAAATVAPPAAVNSESLRFDFTEGHAYWSGYYPGEQQEQVLIEVFAQREARAPAPLAVRVPRGQARPEDRWIDAVVRIAEDIPTEQTRLEAALYAGSGEQPLERITCTPAQRLGLLSIDLRTRGLSAARVRLDLFHQDRLTATATLLLTDAGPVPLPDGRPIEIHLDRPTQIDVPDAWPVVCGVPFPRGMLWDAAGLRLVTESGVELPLQTEATASWSREGSIQWLRVDTLAPAGERLYLEPGRSEAQPPVALTVHRRDDGRVELDTGAARYVIAAGRSPIESIAIGGQPLARLGAARGLYVIDQHGREACAAEQGASIRVEAAGPVAACVRIEGDYVTAGGEALARHITRIEVFAGQPFAHVTHTLVITRDTNEIWFREIGWELEAEVGQDARAVFNVGRDDPAATVTAELADGDAVAYMLQREHRRFGAGEDRFEVAAGGHVLAEGAECGDWALLGGSRGALLMGCAESARQHPKEFEVSADRMTLRLFSPRAGEELDFRGATLAEKWNLSGDLAEKAAQTSPSAAGWAKTHDLLIAPLPAPDAERQAARLAALRREPVYGLADPQWIFESDAMGPLHPRDPKRYPGVEALIDRIFAQVQPRGHETGHYGFIDYFAGPTYGGGSGPCRAGRYRFAYGLRNSIWLAYARSGRRDIRAFAEGTNRAYLDNYLTHADAPGKTRGVWSSSGGSPLNQLPYYWGTGSSWNLSSSSNLNQFLWLYHLTGNRRARDAVVEFGEGFKRDWTPGTRDWRVLMVFRMLTQCYGLTWDPALRVLAEATFDSFVDEESELLLTKDRPYGSSSYKTREDVRGLIEGWRLFGEPKYLAVAGAVANFWWREEIGTHPVGRMRALPHVSALLYGQSGSPAVLAGLEAALLRTGRFEGPVGTSALCTVFESLPYAMGTLARAQRAPASWIQYRDYGYRSSVIAQKPLDGILDFTVQAAAAAPGSQFELQAVGVPGAWGRDLDRVRQFSKGAGLARVPKDAPAGAYQIVPLASGDHFVALEPPGPMVLYAPRYWHLPAISPGRRVYFKVSDQARSPRIQFEGLARLFDPSDELFGAPEGQKGWVDLPADRPGLWSFEPLENRLVRVSNLPPFFAFGSPDLYFEPPIEWPANAPVVAAPERPDPDAVFVPGAVEGETALYLCGRRSFQLEAGPPHPSGDGGRFLPYRAGTIEFFFKPDWHTFDLSDGQRRMIQVQTDASAWSLTYRIDPEGTRVSLGPRDPSHSLYGSMNLDNGSHLRNWYTGQLFEAGQWVHIAWSWGPETVLGPRYEPLQLMTMRLFVNGRGRRAVIFRSAVDALAAGVPQNLVVGPMDGTIAQLRISDIHRYTEDFEPLSPGRPLAADAHTRALFHFNGSLEGRSYELDEPAPGRLEP